MVCVYLNCFDVNVYIYMYTSGYVFVSMFPGYGQRQRTIKSSLLFIIVVISVPTVLTKKIWTELTLGDDSTLILTFFDFGR